MNFSFQSYCFEQIIMQRLGALDTFGPIPSYLRGGGYLQNIDHSIWHMVGTDHLVNERTNR